MYISTGITVIIGAALAMGGYAIIWPIFGSANQLLAALALMAVALWLKKSHRDFSMITLPMIFMLIVTLSALVFLIKDNFIASNYVLVIFPVLLFILAIVLVVKGYQVLFGEEPQKIGQTKQ